MASEYLEYHAQIIYTFVMYFCTIVHGKYSSKKWFWGFHKRKFWGDLPLSFNSSACLFLVYSCALFQHQSLEPMVHTQCWVIMAVSQGESKLLRQQPARTTGMVLASHSVSNRLAWQLIPSSLKECVPLQYSEQQHCVNSLWVNTDLQEEYELRKTLNRLHHQTIEGYTVNAGCLLLLQK